MKRHASSRAASDSGAAAPVRQQQRAHGSTEGGRVVLVVGGAPGLAFDEHGQQAARHQWAGVTWCMGQELREAHTQGWRQL